MLGEHEAAGARPVTPTIFAAEVHMGEHEIAILEGRGSNPLCCSIHNASEA